MTDPTPGHQTDDVLARAQAVSREWRTTTGRGLQKGDVVVLVEELADALRAAVVAANQRAEQAEAALTELWDIYRAIDQGEMTYDDAVIDFMAAMGALVADQPATETNEQRDARFAPGNDATWGAGNWVRCDTCPPDDQGRAVYHHRDAHPVADQPEASQTEAT